MQEIDLGDDTHQGDAGARLLAYMLYPDDEGSRDHLMATIGAVAIDSFSKMRQENLISPAELHLPADFDVAGYWDDAVTEMTNKHSLAYGGGLAVVTGGGLPRVINDVTKAHGDWMACGLMLLTVANLDRNHSTLRRGASLGKSVDLLEAFTRLNRDKIWKAWKKYKSVATLCAAYMALFSTIDKKAWDGDDLDTLGPLLYCPNEILGIAKWMEGFSTSFKPHGRSVAILERSEIWTIPSQANIEAISVKFAPLSPEQMAWLEGRRAPIRDQ